MISLLFVVYFLIFIGIIDYPFISRLINEKTQGSVVESYREAAGSVEEREKELLLEAARAYNQKLAKGSEDDPDAPFENPGKERALYYELLNLTKTGLMGVIRIPKIEVSLPVYHGTEASVLELGAGHLEGTSLPVGGEDTHACISAHRGLPTKKMFSHLDMLKEGDYFYLDILGETMAYEVYETKTRLPEEVGTLTVRPGEDLVTLLTCTPYGINTHRLFVYGRRVPLEAAEEADSGVTTKEYWMNRWWVVLTVFLLQWMLLILYWFNRRSITRDSVKAL